MCLQMIRGLLREGERSREQDREKERERERDGDGERETERERESKREQKSKLIVSGTAWSTRASLHNGAVHQEWREGAREKRGRRLEETEAKGGGGGGGGKRGGGQEESWRSALQCVWRIHSPSGKRERRLHGHSTKMTGGTRWARQ